MNNENILTDLQKQNLLKMQEEFANRPKPERKYTKEEIILKFLEAHPDDWFPTWSFRGNTEWGFLSHATHAALRSAQQKGLILKDYVGKYVVYSHNHNKKAL